MNAFLLLAALLCADPDVEAMKRSLETQIGVLQRLNSLEARVTDLEQKGGDHPSDVVPGSGATGPRSDQVAPEFAPTSHEAIQFALSMYRGILPQHTFVDIGCGDGRVLIAAVRKWNCSGLGIEIDPEQAALARRCVEAAGLSHKITIREGDATAMDFRANAGFAYLYPETLKSLEGKIAAIPAFVSYQHPVTGLQETVSEHGKFYSKEPKPQVVYRDDGRRYAVWNGVTYFQEYRPGCNCAMCQSIRGQLRIPRTVAVEQHAAVPELKVETTGRWWYGCLNGRCGWHWVQ